jgi:uncharacterized membrane protein YhhN
MDRLALTAFAVAALATGLHVRAEYRGPRWQVYLFKPLIVTALLTVAACSPPAHGARYQLAITLGLACSLFGDIFLMLPRDRFLPGLGSFLLAHLAYLVAFTSGTSIAATSPLLLPLLAAAALLLYRLWPALGRLRLPVALYTGTILLMAWQAWSRQRALSTPGSTLAAIGATLFMVSDAILALNRFHRPLPGAQAVVMTTYAIAQALIAASVGMS